MIGLKFTISINQKALIDGQRKVPALGELDVIDLAIFDFMCDFAHSPNCARLIVGTKHYYWFAHKYIIKCLPTLRITSVHGIKKRINKLIEAGLVERYESNDETNKSYYCFGENYNLLVFEASSDPDSDE